MNIIEAIKSGKPFRRGQNQSWMTPSSHTWPGSWPDIIADDWETQEPTITITRDEFNAAIEWALTNYRESRWSIGTLVGNKLFGDKP